MKAYLAGAREYYDPTTWKEIGRKLRRIARAFDELRARGLVTTTNPRRLAEPDVLAFLGWVKGLDPSTQKKYVRYLEDLTLSVKNTVVQQMRVRKRFRIRVPKKPLHPLPQDRLDVLRSVADAVEGWEGDVLRFVVGGLPCCGLRTGEVLNARSADVDTVRWVITVSAPKGEGAWTAGGDDGELAPILPPGRQAFLDFLAARDAYLRSHGLDPQRVELLVPYISPRTGLVHPWNESVLSRLKCRKLEDVAGFRFQIRDLRSTFGQVIIDRLVDRGYKEGAAVERASPALRHRTTKTTEQFYSRIRSERAFEEIERAWS